MKKKTIISSAFIFVVLMGFVSMLSDMTHEGARSIYGSFLGVVGATPKVISIVSGLGEFIGCSLILLTGFIAQKTKKYWLMTLIGYGVNLIAVPLLALTVQNGWIYACGLILLERIGRSIRKPAKNTLVSFASKEMGEGKTFALQEFLDQLGAFIGPTILTGVLLLQNGQEMFTSYKVCFLVLIIPAILCLVLLFIGMKKYPHPENFEESNVEKGPFKIKKSFIFYIIAISLSAIGFIDFPLIISHIQSLNIMNENLLPLLYSLAMLIDAFSAVIFGILYDKIGMKALMISSFLAAFFSVLIFTSSNLWLILIGIVLWGIGMGAQESILKAGVATIVSKDNRSMGFGVFEFCFGAFWFLGSLVLGILYEKAIPVMIGISIIVQLFAIPLLFICEKFWQKEKNQDLIKLDEK